MSPLPRLAHPRGPSARIAAMVARAPAAPPAEQLSLPLTIEAAAPSPPQWQGPVLLQAHAPSIRDVEQRERGCPRVGQCEDDWVMSGREGQARCPAGCGVWLHGGGEGDG